MKTTCSRLIFLCSIICIVTVTSHTQQVFTPLDSWKVTIIGVQTDNYDVFSSQQRGISIGLLPLLAGAVKEVETRYISPEEKYLAREKKRTDALFSLNTSLTQILESNDISALGNENSDIRNQRRQSQKKIKDLQDRIHRIQNLANEDIPMPSSLPIEYKEQTQYIHISHIENFSKIARELAVHSLFYYKVYPLNQFMIVEVLEYNAIQQRTQRVLRTVVNPNQITQVYESIELRVQDFILGVPSASLKVQAKKNDEEILFDAQILLDGVIVGFGEASISTIASGAHALSVIYDGTQRNEIIILESGDNATRNFLFDIKVKDTITITSNPSNVKVYINTEWVGNTPVVIPKPELILQAELHETRYESHRVSISNDFPSVYHIDMIPKNIIPGSDRLEDSRKKFYNSFAMFALSLAVPIVLNGFYINEVRANSSVGSSLSAQGKESSLRNQAILLYSSIGTAAISTGLGVFSFIRLQEYLDTAGEYHDR